PPAAISASSAPTTPPSSTRCGPRPDPRERALGACARDPVPTGMRVMRRPEVLAPAGDRDAMRAAVRAGADAVYFGLWGVNARALATSFDAADLAETMRFLHAHGVRGYVTLNTLVFDDELPLVERAIRACAEAGVDAVIVQDLGVARMVR